VLQTKRFTRLTLTGGIEFDARGLPEHPESREEAAASVTGSLFVGSVITRWCSHSTPELHLPTGGQNHDEAREPRER
jgi:hypothetical protein